MNQKPAVQLVVNHLDGQTCYYPANTGWRVDPRDRCLVIGRGLPRKHIPLDTVASFDIEAVGAQTPEDAGIFTKTVTAKQWTGDNAAELTRLMSSDRFDPHGAGENPDDPDALASFRDSRRGGTWQPLATGKWVLRDDAGDWHACPNDRFVATYKPVGVTKTYPEGFSQDLPVDTDDPGPVGENSCAQCGEAIAKVGDAWYHDVPDTARIRGHDATPANLASV